MKKFLTLVAVAFAGLALAKTEIEVPTLAPAVYDGTVQAAQVPVSPNWRTAFVGKGEHAGTYDVVLKLTDPANTCWKGSAACWTAVPFVIAQATNRWTTAPAISGWTYGETPSVPEAAAAFGAVRPVAYAGETAWGEKVRDAAAAWNAGSYTATFAVEGTDDYTALREKLPFAVAPRPISAVTVAAIPDVTETGTAIRPSLTVTDGTPSLVSSADYSIAYADNVKPGTAKVTLYGRRNYTGSTNVFFTIVQKPYDHAVLSGTASWKKADGLYYAQLLVKCEGGYSCGIKNLRLAFADQKVASVMKAQLWDAAADAAVAETATFEKKVYRTVALKASLIVGDRVAALYGVKQLGARSVPEAERVVALKVSANDLERQLAKYTACLLWESKGKTYCATVENLAVK